MLFITIQKRLLTIKADDNYIEILVSFADINISVTAGAVWRAAGGIASMAEQVAGGRIDEEDSKGVQVDCLS